MPVRRRAEARGKKRPNRQTQNQKPIAKSKEEKERSQRPKAKQGKKKSQKKQAKKTRAKAKKEASKSNNPTARHTTNRVVLCLHESRGVDVQLPA
jgi:hypothetical protein